MNGVASKQPIKLENGAKVHDKKKKKKKKSRKERKVTTLLDVEIKEEEQVEVEYVAANPLEEMDPNDPAFEEFASIFQKFNTIENQDDAVVEEGEDESAQGKDLEQEKILSKKAKKREKRLSIAVLKSLVKRPDLVEAWDVTSADPAILVFLKSYRNTVPVPRHWNQKRRYLQGKRGIEKLPFQLPEFIAATGIS